MSGSLAPTQRATGPEDFGTNKAGVCARWLAEIEMAQRETNDWHKRAAKIWARYLDVRDGTDKDERRFNILWSNVQTLFPAVYARTPKPVVQRRFLDADPVARNACTILERNIAVNNDRSHYDAAIRLAVLDYLLPGRGTTWARYEPHFRSVSAGAVQQAEAAEGASGAAPMDAQPEGDDDGVQVANDGQDEYSEITYEEVCWDYVHYTDFLTSPARIWEEVRWVARRVRMTREEGTERFGASFADVPLAWRPSGITDAMLQDVAYQVFQRATVWEIWNRAERRVIWIAEGHDKTLDQQDDPLKLEAFFPCPKPLYATISTNSLIPVPDYAEYQDQAEEIDDLTRRISKVTSAIKVAGVYNAADDGIQRIFNEGVENELIPVNNWGGFAEKGGLKGAMDLLPVADMAAVLQQLQLAREQSKANLYEITGMSDIMRGQGNANETATAQRIKGQFGTMRLRDRVNEVARFARDMTSITGEIIAKHFSPDTMLIASDYAQTLGADQQQAQAAVQLLKTDQIRGFRIDIETDSTVIPDQEQEQQSRMAFLQAVGGFLQQAIPAAQANPKMAPILGQMMLFGVRAFPVGRQLEGVFEQAIAALEKDAQTPKPPPPPTPDEIRANAAMLGAQSKAQADQVKAAADQQKMQQDAAMAQQAQQLQDAELQLRVQEQALAERDQQLKALQLELEQAKVVEAARNAEADRDHDAAMQMAGHVVTMTQHNTPPAVAPAAEGDA